MASSGAEQHAGNGATLGILSGVSVGMWKATNSKHVLWLLTLPRQGLFVVIVAQNCSDSQSCRLASSANILQQLGAQSPFRSSMDKSRKNCVFAFEVPFDAITGIDYSAPLIRRSRLVLESKNVRKLEFDALEHVIDFYCGFDDLCVTAATHPNMGLHTGDQPGTPVSSGRSSQDFQAKARINLINRLNRTTPTQIIGNDVAVNVEGIGRGGNAGSSLCGAASSPSFSCNPLDRDGTPTFDDSPTKNGTANSMRAYEVHPFSDGQMVYEFRLITLYWTDPMLSEGLRPVIEGNEGLLKLYESGLPSWAVFFCHYGLYYRPWLRLLTWILFYTFTTVSLVIGFYDLWRTLPGLQALLLRVLGGVWLPPLEWIQTHTRVRLSLLLTYIFGKSELFAYSIRALGEAARVVRTLAEPLLVAVSPVFNSFVTVAKAWFVPLVKVSRGVAGYMHSVVFPPLQLMHGAISVPIVWIFTAFRQVQGMLVATAGVVGTMLSARIGPLLSSGGSVASGGLGFSLGRNLTSELLEALRTSLLQATRSMNSVWRFVSHVASGAARHRITLARRTRRLALRVKTRVLAFFEMIGLVLWAFMGWVLGLFKAAGVSSHARNDTNDDDKKVCVGRTDEKERVMTDVHDTNNLPDDGCDKGYAGNDIDVDNSETKKEK